MIDTPVGAALRLIECGMYADEACKRFGIPLVEVQQACGEREAGHDYDTFSNGDPAGPYFEVWRCCAVCGAPDEREGYPVEAW